MRTVSALGQGDHQAEGGHCGNTLGSGCGTGNVIRVGGGDAVLAGAVIRGSGGGGGGSGLGSLIIVVVVLLVIVAANVGLAGVQGATKVVNVGLAGSLALGVANMFLDALTKDFLADQGGHGLLVVLQTGSRIVGGAETLVREVVLEEGSISKHVHEGKGRW